MSARQKFMFDTDFSLTVIKPAKDIEPAPPPPDLVEEEEEAPPPTFSEEDLAAAREQGYIEGRNAALEDAQSALENRLGAALEAVVAKFDAVFEIQKSANEETLGDAVAVACVLIRKLFPAYIKAHGLSEIEALAHETVMHVIEESRVMLHVHEDLKPGLEDHLADFAAEKGFEGRIIVTGDPTMAHGDCRIEWEHGGLARDLSALWGEIDAIVERNMNRALPVFDDTTKIEETLKETPREKVENTVVSDENDPLSAVEPVMEEISSRASATPNDDRPPRHEDGGAGEPPAPRAETPGPPPDSASAQEEPNSASAQGENDG